MLDILLLLFMFVLNVDWVDCMVLFFFSDGYGVVWLLCLILIVFIFLFVEIFLFEVLFCIIVVKYYFKNIKVLCFFCFKFVFGV